MRLLLFYLYTSNCKLSPCNCMCIFVLNFVSLCYNMHQMFTTAAVPNRYRGSYPLQSPPRCLSVTTSHRPRLVAVIASAYLLALATFFYFFSIINYVPLLCMLEVTKYNIMFLLLPFCELRIPFHIIIFCLTSFTNVVFSLYIVLQCSNVSQVDLILLDCTSSRPPESHSLPIHFFCLNALHIYGRANATFALILIPALIIMYFTRLLSLVYWKKLSNFCETLLMTSKNKLGISGRNSYLCDVFNSITNLLLFIWYCYSVISIKSFYILSASRTLSLINSQFPGVTSRLYTYFQRRPVCQSSFDAILLHKLLHNIFFCTYYIAYSVILTLSIFIYVLFTGQIFNTLIIIAMVRIAGVTFAVLMHNMCFEFCFYALLYKWLT